MNISTLTDDVLRAKNTLLQQLSSLNYNVEKYNYLGLDEYHTMIDKKDFSIHVKHNIDENKKVYVLFQVWQKTIRPKDIESLIDLFYRQEDDFLNTNDTLVIISADDTNEVIENTLKHLWDTEKIYVIITSLKKLTINILEHTFVPKHTILTEEQTQVILKRYKATLKTLPEISRFDPVARCILLRPNQVVEIQRPSKTSITALYYRVCV